MNEEKEITIQKPRPSLNRRTSSPSINRLPTSATQKEKREEKSKIKGKGRESNDPGPPWVMGKEKTEEETCIKKRRGSSQHSIFRMVGSPLQPLCQPHPAKGGGTTPNEARRTRHNNATMKPTMLVHRLKPGASTLLHPYSVPLHVH